MDKIIRRREAPSQALQGTGLHPLLERVYAARGVASADELALGAEHLIPPEQLTHCTTAATLLADALQNRLRILVVGDYDADGATSSALAVSALRELGAQAVDYLVPNRFEYGYGLTPEIVALAAERAPDLIITVDNGISSIDGVLAARTAGIATLVTDHHLAGEELPAADVIVNPNQPGCPFPSKALAGVGVIFYIMLALRAELRSRGWFASGRSEPNLGHYLDLVALGTVADVVPLDRNNRILVEGGLRRIRSGRARPGILALLEVAGRNHTRVVASDLGFTVGPRLNAAGRLDDMAIGIECLLCEDQHRARAFASRLHQFNQERRSIEREMQDTALALLDEMPLADDGEVPLAIALHDPRWHEGVIGILASRIKDRLHRPTIAFADAADGSIKGSARSIPGIHIRDILDAVASRNPGLISKFGGHAMAAGLSLGRDDLPAFREAFLAEVSRHADDVQLQAVVDSDGELAATDFDLAVAEALRFAGPWGQHFPEPVFDGRFGVVQQRIVGERHLKLVLSVPASGAVVDAIAFNIDPDCWPKPEVTELELAYRLDINDFRGQQSVQLVVEQLQIPA